MFKTLISKYFITQQVQDVLLQEIIMKLIEEQAKTQDNEINTALMNELIVKYAQSEKELYNLNKLKNKFVGMAAHDLRNPLAVIIGFSDLMILDNDSLSPEHQEFVNIINETSKKMLDLLNELLDITSIESGTFKLTMTHQPIENLIREKVHLNGFIANAKNITLIEDYSPTKEVSYDFDKLGQVIDNFITNAIKFSMPETKIFIKVYQEQNFVKVTVTDSGPGIPDDEKENLFKEFARTSVKPTAGEKSTGLGLAIAKKILDAHKAKIIFSSQVGRGSTFGFELPLQK